MSTSYTPNVGLGEPATNDQGWGTVLNTNFTQLDGLAALGALAVKLHENPSTSLNIAVAAGTYRAADGTIVSYAGTASHAVTASINNFLYLTDSGTLTIATAFPATGNFVPLAVVLAGSSTITSVTDARAPYFSRGGHVHWGVGSPTIAAGAGAGTSPAVSLTGSDQAGLISLTTGSSPTASAVVATITFGQAFSATPRAVILTPAGTNAAALTTTGAVWADSGGVSTTAFTLNVGSTALAATTAYKWWYEVVG